MLLKKKNLVAVVTCVMMLAAAPLSVYAKDGGGHGGGNGGGNGGGHGGGNGAGNGGGHGGGNSAGNGGTHGGLASGHLGEANSKSHSTGLKSDPAGKAVRSHGTTGNHYGSIRNDSNGHGQATSGIAHSKDTRGLAKATAISGTTPGDHNAKGLSNAADSTTKNDR
ncbi:hypothetical protein ACQKQA_21695 [Pseudomonas sp. NPDC089530]|uniref:hypothetical protein n=1 Tax=Pseudomonas sp. NPDC089530 TaxID=3390651 RepID=UPI003CFFFE6F